MTDRFRILCMALLALCPLLPFAQSSDLQTRAGVQLNQNLPKGFDLSVQYQARFDHMSQAFSGSYVSADLGYKLGKHWSTDFEIRFATSNVWDKFRFGIGLTGKAKVEKIDLSAKLRYQYEHYLQNLPEIGQFPDRNNIRLKLQAQRKVVKHVFAHISTEPQFRITSMQGSLQRVRNIVGLDWEFIKRHHIDCSYYYQPQFKGLQVNSVHILVATYAIDLPKWKKKKDDDEKPKGDKQEQKDNGE